MNVLIIGKDSTIFEEDTSVLSDTRKRHNLYAKILQDKCGSDSEIRVISYSKSHDNYSTTDLKNGLKIYPTNSKYRYTFLFDILRLIPSVLKGWKPDLITVQTPWEEGLLAFFLSKWLGCKLLFQLHFDIFSNEWLNEKRWNRVYFFLSKLLLKKADGVRVVSLVLQQKICTDLGIPREKLPVIPVGVNFKPISNIDDKSFYKSRIEPCLKDKLVVLFVGRLCKQKNIPLWLDVAKSVKENIRGVHFVVAGDGSLRSQLQNLAEQKGLSENITFLGPVGYSHLSNIYAAADLFLLTSDYEGYGRVIVEAFLSKLPVVSTACTGPEDLIIDGESGVLTQVGDAKALATAVIGILQDSEKAKKMAEAGHTRMLKKFSSSVLSEQLIDCWVNMCGLECV